MQNKFLDFTNLDKNARDSLRDRIHVVINAPHMFVIPDELKVKTTEQDNREILDRAIQETIQELTSSDKVNNDEKVDRQVSDAIDQYNASLPTITVV